MAWVENKQQFSTKLCFLTFRPILSERRLNWKKINSKNRRDKTGIITVPFYQLSAYSDSDWELRKFREISILTKPSNLHVISKWKLFVLIPVCLLQMNVRLIYYH
jgi:hypothetical protein